MVDARPEMVLDTSLAAVTQATRLLSVLFHQRRLDPQSVSCPDRLLRCCIASRLAHMLALVSSRESLDLILPAFPFKSRSTRKVLGALPDMAEEQALMHLQRLCDRLVTCYSPGANLILCTDGRVFNDVVGLPDHTITEYRSELERMIDRLGLPSLRVFGLEDLHAGVPFDVIRTWLMDTCADDHETLRQTARRDAGTMRLVNGISRFLWEEAKDGPPGGSRTQARMRCREQAYEVVRRSAAWSRLIAGRFPRALRLSIHPQPPHGSKLGIRLAEANPNLWITPWHGVAVLSGDGFRVMRRHEAEAIDATLVYRDGRPSHYEIR